MVYSVAYNCAKKYTSNTIDYMLSKTSPKQQLPKNCKQKWIKTYTQSGTFLYRLVYTTYRRAPSIHWAPVYKQFHLILNEVM